MGYTISELFVGQEAHADKIITEENISMFADVIDDHNPIHLDEKYASQTSFKHRIAHGVILNGLISGILGMQLPGEGCIYASQNIRYLKPVYIGDIITATVSVLEIDMNHNKVKMLTECKNQKNEVVASGEAIVYPHKRSVSKESVFGKVTDNADLEINEKSIIGASYAGKPVSNTAMYVTSKVASLLDNLFCVSGCLVFVETGMKIPEKLQGLHEFRFCVQPQRDYAVFMERYAKKKMEADKRRKYKLTDKGYYIGDNVQIGENAFIEPQCVIGHDVIIGKNAEIHAGVIIKNAIIGDNFVAGENAVIGAYGFTMAEDENGDKFRIPTLGKVIIGNNVEIGQLNSISVGSGGNTIINDNVKLDGLVHVGHNDVLGKNTEIPAGVIISGFVNTGEHSYMGVNSAIRNRINLGDRCVIGMGAVVTKSVSDDMTVVGNPAREYIKK